MKAGENMSGPKTSRYTLTAEQRRILREQKEKERRINEEKTKLKWYISELNIIYANFAESIEKAQELQKRKGMEELGYLEKAKVLRTQMKEIIDNNSIVTNQVELAKLESQRVTVESYLKSVKQQMKSLSKQMVQIERQLKVDISKNVDKGFTISFENIYSTQQKSDAQNLYEELTLKLELLRRESSMPQEYMYEIDSSLEKIKQIESIDFLENYKALMVIPLEKKCKRYIYEYEKYSEKFHNLFIRYQVLSEMLMKQEKRYEFSVEAIVELEHEIAGLEKQLVAMQEQAYISQCIDEVMEEMGYNLLGNRTVTKRSGKQFRNELYSFVEGTAVNITYSSDGKITMELGGIDREDRVPTIDETERLCEDMQDFCEDFSEIENKLKSKGVVTAQRISILPPDLEHAQIINVEDYNIKTEVRELKTAHERRGERKQQSMRKE
jgi:hypothetical protein